MGWKFNPFTATFDQVGAGSGGGGGAQYIDGEVAAFADLPLDGTAALDSAWLVRGASGVWPVSRKQAGIYIRTATGGTDRSADYTYAGTMPDVFSDANFTVYDDADPTKAMQLNAAGITAGATRTLTVPDASGTIALVATTATAAQGTAADAYRVDVDAYGFINQTETTIAFNPTGGTGGAGQFTISPTGSTWSYYRAGVKHTITGSKSVDVPAATATTTTYFLYLADGTGALTCSTSAWNLDDDGRVPVATVTRNSGLTPAYLLSEERHTVKINRRDHMIEHYTGGAIYSSGGAVSGQTVNSSTDTSKTCAVEAIKFFDEDIYQTTASIADGNATSDYNYPIMYRTGASAWAWERSLMPFRYSGTGAIQYDSNGTMTATTSGSGVNQKWVCYYLLATNINGAESLVFVPGRTQHASLSAAQAEAFTSLTFDGFPAKDATAVWKFIWHTNGANLGLCQLAATPTRVNANISASVAAVSASHNALSGLQGGGSGDYYHLPAGTNASDVATWDAANGVWVSAAPAASGVTTQTDVFTSSGTWTKPDGAKSVEILLIGGGGGGGSGRRGAAGTARWAGGGGGAAAVVITRVNSAALGSSVTVTVGSGGDGGANTGADSDGNNGTVGGNTVFGIWTAIGGNYGGGGTTSAGAAGAARSNRTTIFNAVLSSGAGAAAAAANPSDAAAVIYGPTGGGAGAGLDSSNNTLGASNGGTLGTSSVATVAGGTGGYTPSNGATSAISFFGTGGGGSRSSFPLYSVVAGGNGGNYGAGGGGGCGALNTGAGSNAGGSGGAGIAIITTYF